MKRLLGENDYDADAPSPNEPDDVPSEPGTTTYRVAFMYTVSAPAAVAACRRYTGSIDGVYCGFVAGRHAWTYCPGSGGAHDLAYITVPDHLADALWEQLSEDDDVYGFRREDAP